MRDWGRPIGQVKGLTGTRLVFLHLAEVEVYQRGRTGRIQTAVQDEPIP